MTAPEKPSNPKDSIGSTKVPLALCPATASAEQALAHLEGLTKYGAWNWRAVGVRSSIYLDAAMRHLTKWQNGEERDAKTGVHHLGSVMACCAIILDSKARGNLRDDRPPGIARYATELDQHEKTVKHLIELHKDKSPYHYTRSDDIIRTEHVAEVKELKCGSAPNTEEICEKYQEHADKIKGIVKRETLRVHTIDYTSDTSGYIDGKFETGSQFTGPVSLWKAGYDTVDDQVEAICAEERGE